MVVLAQALVQNAGVLLLDEPASSLDVSHQLALFELLSELNADGLTVICVLHDLNLALTYFDRLLVLSQGGVAAWGTAEEALSPEVLEAVYGVRAHLHRHAGRTFLTFSPRRRLAGPRSRSRAPGLRRRHRLEPHARADRPRLRVSAGVLNALDSDEVTGRELGLPMAVEAPFAPIGDDAHAENLRLIADADLVVLTDVPLGHGNARNLDAVQAALERGAPVWVLEDLLASDHTGAAASLRDTAARFVSDDAAVVAELIAPGSDADPPARLP